MFNAILISLIFGAVFVIFALSFLATYRFEKYINFSYIALFLIGTYLTWTFNTSLGIGKIFSLMLIISISAVFGLIFYLPTLMLKTKYHKILFSIAILGLTQGSLNLIFGTKDKILSKPTQGLMIGNTLFTSTHLMTILIFALFLVIIYIIVKKTRFGKAARAVLSNETVAKTVGINPNFIKLTAMLAASIFAGVSGLLFSLNLEKSGLSLLPGFKAMAIAVIGGFGVFFTTIVSFVIIFIENLAKTYLPFSEYYANFIVFGILLLIMLFRIPRRSQR